MKLTPDARPFSRYSFRFSIQRGRPKNITPPNTLPLIPTLLFSAIYSERRTRWRRLSADSFSSRRAEEVKISFSLMRERDEMLDAAEHAMLLIYYHHFYRTRYLPQMIGSDIFALP